MHSAGHGRAGLRRDGARLLAGQHNDGHRLHPSVDHTNLVGQVWGEEPLSCPCLRREDEQTEGCLSEPRAQWEGQWAELEMIDRKRLSKPLVVMCWPRDSDD